MSSINLVSEGRLGAGLVASRCPWEAGFVAGEKQREKVIVAAAFVAISSAGVFAADLPARVQPVAPVAYVPPFSWTGFYLGGELGWIQTNPKYTTGVLLLGTPFVVSPSVSNKNGLTYGVLGGYNYQVGQLVLGVEGDFAGWTVGTIRYTAITGDFLRTAMGRLDPWAARLCCRPRPVLRDWRRRVRLQ